MPVERALPEPEGVAKPKSAAAAGSALAASASISAAAAPNDPTRTSTVTTANAKTAAQTAVSSAAAHQRSVSEAAKADATGPAANATANSENVLTTILSMDPAMSPESEQEKPPHLQTPPYVHHFDTYTLVRGLAGGEKGGFSEKQAITTMKAVRGLLAVNMDLARDGLVSKGDLEMVSNAPL